MPEPSRIVVRRQAAPDGTDGWLVVSDGTPVGFIVGTVIHTPSGARYEVCGGEMRDAEGRIAATLGDTSVTDAVAGVAWELKDGWAAVADEAEDGSLGLDVWAAFARPYTLEDAQGTVPARVRLMMAWELVRQRRQDMTHGGLN